MNALQRILERQPWIQELKKNRGAIAAVEVYAARFVPGYIKREIRMAAALAGVPYFDVLCCNLSYELAMVATSSAKMDVSGMWKSVIGIQATRVGCTSFAYWGGTGDPDLPCNLRVTFARNLDWPDTDGMLRKYSQVKEYEAARGSWTKPPLGNFQSLSFPGFSGVLTGFAPARFAVALNAVCDDTPVTMGHAPTILLRQVLETCHTYQEAIKMLCRTPLVCGALFTVVSAEGVSGADAGVVIERSPRLYAIRRPERVGDNDWMVCATNDYHTLTGEGGQMTELAATSCKRYLTVKEGLIAERERGELDRYGLVTRSAIASILRDTEFGCTVHRAIFDPGADAAIDWN